jgi:DNA-binding SARP family transcriptional activator
MDSPSLFSLLGPLQVWQSGTRLAVPPGNQRSLLAALLLSPNQMVSTTELTELIWESGPPSSARVTLQNYIKRLRRTLAGTGESRIVTAPHGYLITVGDEELDVRRFEDLSHQADTAMRAGDWCLAADQLRSALALCRGEPLADVPSELLRAREVPRLAEMHMQALESRVEADLQLGRHAKVIADLQQLTVLHPLRERLRALLMLALYRDGQQAAAQAVFRDVRKVLVEELGTEPGPELRQMHQRILAADPGLDPPVQAERIQVTAAPGPRDDVIVPRQLPAAVRHFTGRVSEMAALTSMLTERRVPGVAVVMSAIAGTAGVGKTAAAVCWAHQEIGLFPDGQLYVNLRGYDPSEPVDPAEALAGFLRALGESSDAIPAELDERAARYRSRVAGRRMLILLDNAGSEEQVRPLLPGTPECAVLITSRDALPGLVAREGVRRLELDLMPLQDAAELLAALIGDRALADRAATEALARLCARLPLALRIAAEFAAGNPSVPLAELARGLEDQRRRLDWLRSGDDRRTAVRAVFSWSYGHLPEDAARSFALLGLHPGTDFGASELAALAGCAEVRARDWLAELARAHLIQPASGGRYGMHDLLRAYAVELADSLDEREAAVRRMLSWYLHCACAAAKVISPARKHVPPAPPAPGVMPLAFRAYSKAIEWLDTTYEGLVAAVSLAAAHSEHQIACQLPIAMWDVFALRGNVADWIAAHETGLASARMLGDRVAQGRLLNNLGLAYGRAGRAEDTLACVLEALDLAREADQEAVPRRLQNAGITLAVLGRLDEAIGYLQEGLALIRAAGDANGEARILLSLGSTYRMRHDIPEAVSHLQAALKTFTWSGDRVTQAETLFEMSLARMEHGQLDEASLDAGEAVRLSVETGNRFCQAKATVVLGQTERERGHLPEARRHLADALAIYSQLGLTNEADSVAADLAALPRLRANDSRSAGMAVAHAASP